MRKSRTYGSGRGARIMRVPTAIDLEFESIAKWRGPAKRANSIGCPKRPSSASATRVSCAGARQVERSWSSPNGEEPRRGIRSSRRRCVHSAHRKERRARGNEREAKAGLPLSPPSTQGSVAGSRAFRAPLRRGRLAVRPVGERRKAWRGDHTGRFGDTAYSREELRAELDRARGRDRRRSPYYPGFEGPLDLGELVLRHQLLEVFPESRIARDAKRHGRDQLEQQKRKTKNGNEDQPIEKEIARIDRKRGPRVRRCDANARSEVIAVGTKPGKLGRLAVRPIRSPGIHAKPGRNPRASARTTATIRCTRRPRRSRETETCPAMSFAAVWQGWSRRANAQPSHHAPRGPGSPRE